MSDIRIRHAEPRDRQAIASLLDVAFGQPDEARLVEALVAGGHGVLDLVAEVDGVLAGHVLFSRLTVEGEGGAFPALALAPVAVLPAMQNRGIGSHLIEEGHAQLERSGEALSIVLGEPSHYSSFGYSRARAASFESDYQGEYLQALAWREAPATGRLVYAPPFTAL
ncbi:MAG: N-acetyltransferase [Rhizobiaceae bacterium]|nr:N-acetyltransferase [Rhizobiaceae bacterium]